MKTSILIIIGLALAIVVSAILFGSRYYGVIESVQDVTALNSEDELFVFIGHTKGVLTDTRFRLLGKELTSVLLAPEHISDDLLLVHFKEGKLSRLET